MISTASMSARGTMTSSTRTSRNRRILLSIARSPGEKAASSAGASSASASAMSSRRLEPLRCLKKPASRSKSEGRSGVGWATVLGPSSDWPVRLFFAARFGLRGQFWWSRSSSSGDCRFLLRVGIGNGKPARTRRSVASISSASVSVS